MIYWIQTTIQIKTFDVCHLSHNLLNSGSCHTERFLGCSHWSKQMPSTCNRSCKTSLPSQSYHWICKTSLPNSANLIWFNPPYVRGETHSVLSKPFSWPEKSENKKEQNFSQNQTETNLFKSSVLLKYLKQAMIINKTWLWNRMSGVIVE